VVVEQLEAAALVARVVLLISFLLVLELMLAVLVVLVI
jgi:hypothetical protein